MTVITFKEGSEMSKTRIPWLACVGFVLAAMPIASANIIANPSFEEGTYFQTNVGGPFVADAWQGLDAAEFSLAAQGITPLDGYRMLRFIWAGAGAGSNIASNVVNITDVSAYSDIISSGQAVAQASAYFNRVAGDAQTDTWFQMNLYAFDGPLDSLYSKYHNGDYLLRVRRALTDSDADTATWESLFLEKALPTGTNFVLLEVMAVENVHNDISGAEFDGHFADMVSVTIIPEPASLVLLSASTVLLMRKKR